MDWFLAVIVAPFVSYVIFLAVFWLSHFLIFLAVEGLPTTRLWLTLARVVILVLPFVASYVATRKWIRFCVERYGLHRLGIMVHIGLVLIAVIATLMRLAMILPCG